MGYLPYCQEVHFGMSARTLPRLQLHDDLDHPVCYLHGVIDRIDISREGKAP